MGFDFVANNGNLSGSIDFYHNNVNDLMVNHPVVAATIWRSDQTVGAEMELNVSPVHKNDFIWNTSLFFSANKSVLDRFSTTAKLAEEEGYLWLENGNEAGLIYAYDVEEELLDGAYVPVNIKGSNSIRFEEDAKNNWLCFSKK